MMYYACLEFRPEKHGKGEKRVIKEAFTDRAEARAYISKEFNPELHTACWTE